MRIRKPFWALSALRILYVLAVVGVMAFCISLSAWASGIGNYRLSAKYPNLTKIVEIDRINHVVTCVDFNGNLWEFEEDDDWCVGDYCNLLMDDCGTDEIYDDVIVGTYYERVDF